MNKLRIEICDALQNEMWKVQDGDYDANGSADFSLDDLLESIAIEVSHIQRAAEAMKP